MNARALILVLLITTACYPRQPLVDTGNKPDQVGGTIAGLVRASDGATPLSARKVSAIDTESGVRFDVSTASNGGYTMKVPAGKYRLEVELRQGEILSMRPDSTQINPGDIDAGRDFVVSQQSTVGSRQ